MKKSELKHGMIIRTSGGRYGVVCLQDATDKNVIKMFYDPNLLLNNGYVKESAYGDAIISLEEFDEDLNMSYYDENDKTTYTVWSIDEVFTLNSIFCRECTTMAEE